MRRESAKLAFAELQGLMLHAVFGPQELLADRQSTIKIRAIRTALTYGLKSTDLDRLLQALKPFLASLPPERQHDPGVSPTPVRRQPFPSDLAEVDASSVLSRMRPAPPRARDYSRRGCGLHTLYRYLARITGCESGRVLGRTFQTIRRGGNRWLTSRSGWDLLAREAMYGIDTFLGSKQRRTARSLRWPTVPLSQAERLPTSSTFRRSMAAGRSCWRTRASTRCASALGLICTAPSHWPLWTRASMCLPRLGWPPPLPRPTIC